MLAGLVYTGLQTKETKVILCVAVFTLLLEPYREPTLEPDSNSAHHVYNVSRLILSDRSPGFSTFLEY